MLPFEFNRLLQALDAPIRENIFESCIDIIHSLGYPSSLIKTNVDIVDRWLGKLDKLLLHQLQYNAVESVQWFVYNFQHN